MGFANTELRISELEISNFRRFESLSIDFDQQLTVLVGDNGTGKSTLIDAASIALGTLFHKIEYATSPSISSDDARGVVIKQGDMTVVQPQYPVVISAAGVVANESISWTRSLNSAKSRTTRADAKTIVNAGERIQQLAAANDSDLVLPILARYGTDRLWKQDGPSSDILPNRTRGYEDALQAASNDSRMNAWFKRQSLWEWQNKRESAVFTAVKKALATCFDSAASIDNAMVDYDAELQQLIFTFRDANGIYHRDRLHSMSDGYRGTISLIADIAYRMATLNPALREHVLETPGVVLIDEIDLHLHPRWQARILDDLVRIFPNVQFITTTHSPVVVASVPRNNIRILEECSTAIPATETRGRDASDILNTVLGATSRPENVMQLFASFNRAIDEEDYRTAKDVIINIESLIGGDDPDVIAAKTTLELEELLS